MRPDPSPFVPATVLPGLLEHPDGSPWCGPCEILTEHSVYWLPSFVSPTMRPETRLDTRRPEVRDHLVRVGDRWGYDWEHLREDPEGLALIVRLLGAEYQAGRIQAPEVNRET